MLHCSVWMKRTPRIQEHCNIKGGIAAVYENGYVSILKGNWKIRVEQVREIPLTFGGKAIHNIMNTLPAVLATYLYRNIRIEDIRLALQTFIPSPIQTPGRMNLFQFKRCQILLDFAHNPAGLKLLCNFIDQYEATRKIGIIAGTGDRRDEDIKELGRISAQCFDEIIIRQDSDLRGRTAEEIIGLLYEGINETKSADFKVREITDEADAIIYAYQNAINGALITVLADKVHDSIELIKKLQKEEEDATSITNNRK